MSEIESTSSSIDPVLTDAVQIIDDNNEYNPQFIEMMQRWNLIDAGYNYNLVAILGPQSSGKSTLLNLLFGTTFAVLDATTRRGQTTKGIWCSKALDTPLLILDVEGTDGRERADDMNFERKSSLFSLALAPVLLINMWYQDVGRWNAANMVLLRVVFELNLQLFIAQRGEGQPVSKHLLVFVLRDHMMTPISELSRIILDDMTKLWTSISKPDKFADSLVQDFFDFQFVPLPNKILAADQFGPAVAQFKSWFYDPECEHYLWKDGKYPVDVPSDGFIHYSSNIWEVVKTNKDLDIPSQKQLLARFRCDEIAAQARALFASEFIPLRTEAEAASSSPDGVPLLGDRLAALISRAVSSYNGPAARYDRQVAAEIRVALLLQISAETRVLYRSYLHRLIEHAKTRFDAALSAEIDAAWEAVRDNWAAVVLRLRADALSAFDMAAAAALPRLDLPALLLEEEAYGFAAEWSPASELAVLSEGLDLRIAAGRGALLQRYDEAVRRGFESALDRPVSEVLDSEWSSAPELWAKVRAAFARSSAACLEQVAQKLAESFESGEGEISQTVARLQARFVEILTALLRSKSSFARVRMQKRFAAIFDRDEQGFPRRWKPDDDIKLFYRKALDSAETVLEAMAILRLREEDDQLTLQSEALPSELVLLSADQRDQIKFDFLREADGRYYNALRDQENVNSVEKVPLFMIALLIIFGFNEAVAIISNPFLLVFTFIAGGAGLAIWKLNLYPIIRPVLKTVLHTSVSSVKPFMTSLARNIQEASADHQKTD